MQLELAEYLVNLALETGNYDEDEVNVRESYSGRGMYGRSTAGIVGLHSADIACLILQAAQDMDLTEELEEFDIPSSFSQDSMGLSTIVY